MKITKLIRILMVEDSEADAELIRFELDRGGLEHFSRRVATEAEYQTALESREWDVILSDFHLPGFGGLKALEMLKARQLDIPFILISGTIGEDVAVAAVKAGAHDYLIKGKLSRDHAHHLSGTAGIRNPRQPPENPGGHPDKRIPPAGLPQMEAVGRLAGGVAHNFNNLLMVMSGCNEMLLANLDPAHPLRPDLEQIRDTVAKATLLTKQLLGFSRGHAAAPHPIDLNAVIQDTHPLLIPMLRDDIEFTFNPEAQPARIKADPGQIREVILNLVMNARDAMPNGGKLQLRTGNAYLKEPFPDFASRFKPGNYVAFTVEDTGTGMDEMTPQGTHFRALFHDQGIREGHGTGFGYGLWDSEPLRRANTGIEPAREWFDFRRLFSRPRRNPGSAAAGGCDYAQEPEAVPKGHGTILLAENDEGVRNFILRVLRRHGYQVVAAVNGDEALKLSQECERVHLLLTDVVMPGMGGPLLAVNLHKRHPEAKTIFMSGYSAAEIEGEKHAGKPLDILEKPFSPDRLLRKIQETLEQK